MRLISFLIILNCASFLSGFAQVCSVSGRVVNDSNGKPVAGAEVFILNSSIATRTNEEGMFLFSNIKPGDYKLSVYLYGWQAPIKSVTLVSGHYQLDFNIAEISHELDEVVIVDDAPSAATTRLRSVEGTSIYESKKNEVIVLDKLVASLATNNARQIYATVPGLNIWESDGAGLQLGIGARGLDPNRTSNFNVRQNGYDISADALGYPESYYTPPAEAIDRIQIVRGAASLQYGTQFGGLLNFILRKGPRDRAVEVTSRQSLGSFGLFNSFTSVAGTKSKISYYSFFQHKQADGWRPNSQFNLNMAYGSISYSPNDAVTITNELTYMQYLAKQPGGLTDALYAENPRQSIRDRNWFRVDWNLMASTIDWKINERWKLNSRVFGLIGGRDALGNLGRIDRTDDGGNRDLFVDDFRNMGTETRVVHSYFIKKRPAALLLGVRYYNGFTHRRQGLGPDGKEADFYFLNPTNLEGSDFDFPNKNASFFAENIFPISERITITPGLRFEMIKTQADGYYQNKVLRVDPSTGMAKDSTFLVNENKTNTRSFLIGGVGASYKRSDHTEYYFNASQNYRAINFNDIRVVNPNLVVNPKIHDERGFNIDFGVRGEVGKKISYDVSVFYLRYNGRIGQILRTDTTNFRIYRYRSNIADSRHIGVEAFGQIDLIGALSGDTKSNLYFFANVALTQATYDHSEEKAIEGNQVELVPPVNIKTGLTYKRNKIQTTWQFGYTARQFSDATNSLYTASAVEGEIPTYMIMDLSARYAFKIVTIEGGVNNLLNEMYFTRRAAGYPGPGILPSDGRNFFITVQVKVGKK
jgi:Fe(3+) dicitrate transport protein